MPPRSTPETVTGWLHLHPWGWLILLAALIAGFVLWLSAPLTWRNGEGAVVGEGHQAANFWESLARILWWR